MSQPLMDHDKGRQALLEVNMFLNYCEVPFFLVQGTALGAYRDKGFSIYEKDIDLGFLVEDFVPAVTLLIAGLQEIGFKVSTRHKPFSRPRVIKAERDEVKVDLTSYVPWKGKRFCANTDPALTYAVVHEAAMLEEYHELVLFHTVFKVPHPIEEYLRLEYGKAWKTPLDDSVSRTRVRDYVEKEGIPHEYLDQFAKQHST